MGKAEVDEKILTTVVSPTVHKSPTRWKTKCPATKIAPIFPAMKKVAISLAVLLASAALGWGVRKAFDSEKAVHRTGDSNPPLRQI